nr:MAG TPA: hypothetical protein [Caudoviricetes sp.]
MHFLIQPLQAHLPFVGHKKSPAKAELKNYLLVLGPNASFLTLCS